MGLRIAAREGLPCEVVVLQRKVAGELFEAVAQHGSNGAALGHAGKLVILLRRNAEAEEGAFAGGDPADQRLFEQWSDAVVEELGAVRAGSAFR